MQWQKPSILVYLLGWLAKLTLVIILGQKAQDLLEFWIFSDLKNSRYMILNGSKSFT